MAYVYNQNKEDEVPQSGSNIFNAQPQPGAQPDSSAVSKTGDTGIMAAGGGAGKGPEKSAEQVQQRSAQQRQAAFPLREIFKRNTAAQVGAPDFSKTSNAIAQAGTALQNAANAYTASNVSAVPTIDQETINTYAGIPKTFAETSLNKATAGPDSAAAKELANAAITNQQTTSSGDNGAAKIAGTEAVTKQKTAVDPNAAQEAGNKIISTITPRSAALTKFELPTEAALPTENELSGRFNTSSGLTNEILKANPVVGQSRGAAGLDTAFLQGNTAFQKSKDAILASGKEAIGKQNTLLASLPETTRVAAQAAIDTANANARALLASTAGGYETTAQAKQAAFEAARVELQNRINSGNLSPEMKAQILAAFDAQTSGFTPNQQTMSSDFRNFLSDPNRMGLASSLLSEIGEYGGDVGNYNVNNFNNANLAKGFSVADTSTNLSDFMSDDQYNPYSKISGLLGKVTTRGTSANAQPLAYDPTNATNLAIQYQQMQSDLASGKKQYEDTKTIIQNKINELNDLKSNLLASQQQVPGTKNFRKSPEIIKKELEIQQLFDSLTTKLSAAKKEQLRSQVFPSFAQEPTINFQDTSNDIRVPTSSLSRGFR